MRALLASIALAGLVSAAPAAAQAGEENYSVVIGYGDLNTNSAAGLAAFAGRVRAGATRTCVGIGDSPLQQVLEARKCRISFMRAAEHKLQLAYAPSSGMRLAAR